MIRYVVLLRILPQLIQFDMFSLCFKFNILIFYISNCEYVSNFLLQKDKELFEQVFCNVYVGFICCMSVNDIEIAANVIKIYSRKWNEFDLE